MKVFRRVSFVAIIAIVSVWGLSAKPSFALEEKVFEKKNTEKVTLEPALQEVVLSDQVEVPVTLILENTSSNAESFRLKAVDFGTLDESGGVAFLGTGDPREYDVASWLSLPVEEILVAPESKTKITLTVTNSGKLAPGGHYGAVLFENSSLNTTPDSSRIAVEQVFSALIYMRKVGGEMFALELNEIVYAKSKIKLPENVSLRFTNTGNTHVVPRGSIRITDPIGRTIQKTTLNQESSLVLPGSSRRFEETFVPLATPWIPGHYTALSEYRYDGKDTYEKMTESYWYFPPMSMIVLLSIVAVIVLWKWKKITWSGFKKTFQRSKKKAL
jgi:hypothetical protein